MEESWLSASGTLDMMRVDEFRSFDATSLEWKAGDQYCGESVNIR